MDIISLYYFQELAREPHMTHTAERLFISQQTLSNHILRLEQQLGCQLFERKPSLSLTYAGEQVLQFAETVLKEQTNLTDILTDINQEERGSIRFGASALRANACLAAIMPEFVESYPYVELRLTNGLGDQLIPKLLSGDLDFALVASAAVAQQNPTLLYRKLMDDQIFLCVTEDLLQRYCGSRAANLKAHASEGVYVRDFADLPFCLFTNHMGKQISQCFDDAGITPHVYLTAPYTQIITDLGLKGVSAFFSTRMALSSRRDEIPDNMNIFPLLYRGEPMYQHLTLIYSRQRYLPEYAKTFVNLLAGYFAGVKHEQVTQIVGVPETK